MVTIQSDSTQIKDTGSTEFLSSSVPHYRPPYLEHLLSLVPMANDALQSVGPSSESYRWLQKALFSYLHYDKTQSLSNYTNEKFFTIQEEVSGFLTSYCSTLPDSLDIEKLKQWERSADDQSRHAFAGLIVSCRQEDLLFTYGHAPLTWALLELQEKHLWNSGVPGPIHDRARFTWNKEMGVSFNSCMRLARDMLAEETPLSFSLFLRYTAWEQRFRSFQFAPELLRELYEKARKDHGSEGKERNVPSGLSVLAVERRTLRDNSGVANGYCDESVDFDGTEIYRPAPRQKFILLDITLDAERGFLLAYQGVPFAAVALEPHGESSNIVRQLQMFIPHIYQQEANGFGCRYVERKTPPFLDGIQPFHLLISLAEHFSRETGAEELLIQGAKNNEWTKKIYQEGPHKGRPHLELGRAKGIYDSNAKKLGAVPTACGNWSFNLKKTHLSSP